MINVKPPVRPASYDKKVGLVLQGAVRLHHLGEHADAAPILSDRARGVALVEQMSPEIVQVISEKLDCDVMSALARWICVYVHFLLLRFEEAQSSGIAARAMPNTTVGLRPASVPLPAMSLR